MEEMRLSEEAALESLKAQMSDDQRQDMANIISAELHRRATDPTSKDPQPATLKYKSAVPSSGLSSGLSHEQVGEVYAGMREKVEKARLAKLQRQLEEVKRQAKKAKRNDALKSMRPKLRLPKLRFAFGHLALGRALLVIAICALAVLKIAFSSGAVDASIGSDAADTSAELTATPELSDSADAGRARMKTGSAVSVRDSRIVGWSLADKQILTSLDSRRVELEKRKAALDLREEELHIKAQALTEKLAELRSLTTRLNEKRRVRDEKYEARLEQLAGVYGSMAPNEAAPLIAKLDDSTALGLLQRVPGKRLGQILGAMPDERAVELTKRLTEREELR